MEGLTFLVYVVVLYKSDTSTEKVVIPMAKCLGNVHCNCSRCQKSYQRARSEAYGNGNGKASYGRNTRSGAYSRGTFGFSDGSFDGFPALKRSRDGKTEFFYGTDTSVDGFLENHLAHGHAIIKAGRLIYRRRPGDAIPDIDLGG